MDPAAILATIILLGVLILVHELGHFWAAKSVGIVVERFSIVLGPRLWGFERNGTEYVLAAIPLGGYVKMQGMDDEVMEQIEGGPSDRPRGPRSGDFDSKPIWARAFVISAGVIMNMLFAFLLFALVPAAWGRADLATTRVAAVDAADLPEGTEALARIEAGSEIVRVGDRSTASWGFLQRTLLETPAGPLTVETRAPVQRLEIVAPQERGDRIAMVAALSPWADAVIGAVEPGSPAAAALLEEGDRVVAVAGTTVASWDEMVPRGRRPPRRTGGDRPAARRGAPGARRGSGFGRERRRASRSARRLSRALSRGENSDSAGRGGSGRLVGNDLLHADHPELPGRPLYR